jgi:hypothetical protein
MKFKVKFFRLLLITVFFLGLGISLLLGSVKAQSNAPFLYWPVPSRYDIALNFGKYPSGASHYGIDIGVNTDNTTPIYAAADGEVVYVEKRQPYGRERTTTVVNGNHVKLRHNIAGKGTFYTWYLHLTKDVKVQSGQQVKVGQLLGYGSNSGLTCGTQEVGKVTACPNSKYKGTFWHLHFQVATDCGGNACSKNPSTENWWVKGYDGKIIAATDAIGSQSAAITNVGGKCLDVRNGLVRNDATPVQIYSCNGTNAQKWQFNSQDSTIRNVEGKCLDVRNGDVTKDTTIVQIYSCNGTNAQKWSVPSKGQTGAIRNVGGKCLDVKWGSIYTQSQDVWLYTCNGTQAQQWRP